MEITDLADGLTRALGAFEPGAYSAPDCARLAEQLSATGKACAAASVLAASRAAGLGAHRGLGFSDPASWMAHQAGTTTRQAKDALRDGEAPGGPPRDEAGPAQRGDLLARGPRDRPGRRGDARRRRGAPRGRPQREPHDPA